MNFDANAWRDSFDRARVCQDADRVHDLIDELVAVYGSAAAKKPDAQPAGRGSRFAVRQSAVSVPSSLPNRPYSAQP